MGAGSARGRLSVVSRGPKLGSYKRNGTAEPPPPRRLLQSASVSRSDVVVRQSPEHHGCETAGWLDAVGRPRGDTYQQDVGDCV